MSLSERGRDILRVRESESDSEWEGDWEIEGVREWEGESVSERVHMCERVREIVW